MSIIKVLLLIVVVALITPLTTCIFDALCWFYSSATCTGLVYDGVRVGLLLITTVSSLMLMIFLVG